MKEIHKYVALLRGINVGGKNIIKMSELKTFFEEIGFLQVATYIQSGNVLFQSPDPSHPKLTGKIEKALSNRFQYQSRVVLVSHPGLRNIVESAPAGFGKDPKSYRYDVIFLRQPLSAKAALKTVSTKEGVDEAYAGDGVLYFTRLIDKAASSHLARIITLPIYQEMTIRNWNTTTKLLHLLDASVPAHK